MPRARPICRRGSSSASAAARTRTAHPIGRSPSWRRWPARFGDAATQAWCLPTTCSPTRRTCLSIQAPSCGACARCSMPAEPGGAAPATRGLATYYTLLITLTVSQIGSQISEYAVSIAVFRATGHATPLALVAFFTAAPAVLLGGFAGALADRFDRRAMMLIANLGFVVVSAVLLASFASGAFRLWHLYAL